MKKLVLTLCVVGSTLALAACGTTGNDNLKDDQAPYADERTVGGEQAAPARARPAPAERTFSSAQTK